MVGLLILGQPIEVRILVPEPVVEGFEQPEEGKI